MGVVVAQWTERLLTTPEIRSLNLVIGDIYLLSPVLKRRKEKEKAAQIRIKMFSEF